MAKKHWRYVKPQFGTMRYSKLGGPFTDRLEDEARAKRDSRRPSRIGRSLLRLLGYRGPLDREDPKK